MSIRTAFITLTLSLLTVGAAQAQGRSAPNIDHREARHEMRIERGVASGRLTHREAARLQAQQKHIAQAQKRARADGRLTAAERQHLARLQAQASRSIYWQKHDRQVAYRHR